MCVFRRCRALLRNALIGAALGPTGRSQSFLRFTNIGSDQERVEEVFLRRDDGHSSPESTYLSQGRGRLGRRKDREWKDSSVLDTRS